MAHGIRSGRNPFMAATGGIIFPGTGQFYNGRTKGGIIVWSGLGAMILFAMVFPALHLFCLAGGLGVWLYSIRDAYVTAHRINTGECSFEGQSPLVYTPAILAVSAGTAFMLSRIVTAIIS
jgi:hypothetical protein